MLRIELEPDTRRSRPGRKEWREWFAWWPVIIDDVLYWLEKPPYERALRASEYGHVTWFAYRRKA